MSSSTTPATNPSTDPDDPPPAPPLDPESRKAAAALSALDSSTTIDDAPSSTTPNTNVDQEALGKAMEGLKTRSGVGGGGGGSGGGPGRDEGGKGRKVRIEAADVGLLVDQLEIPKLKATELLRANDGDVVRALRAFIAPSSA
ncbi:MAG: hypothetical protein M1839_007401 [Geoglossum umbratile]|nr:MAG: hypothetical protein M1839_007401 [Geoglossum umbratile]